MQGKLSPLGWYRFTFPAQVLPDAFPRIETAIRNACVGWNSLDLRVAKGSSTWTVTAYRGWTGGCRVEFTPKDVAFGPGEVEVSTFRWSRMTQMALYVSVAACIVAGTAVWLGFVSTLKELSVLGLPFSVVLAGVFFACLGGAASCALMYAGGGRLSDAELVAIGETIAEELIGANPPCSGSGALR
ncbi:hypothetical protein ACYOEI_18080 [Singulisphaera rosea]